MRYAMVVVRESDMGPRTAHDYLTEDLKDDAMVLYVGRPIEVPRAVEYGTDSLWMRVDGEQMFYKHEREE